MLLLPHRQKNLFLRSYIWSISACKLQVVHILPYQIRIHQSRRHLSSASAKFCRLSPLLYQLIFLAAISPCGWWMTLPPLSTLSRMHAWSGESWSEVSPYRRDGLSTKAFAWHSMKWHFLSNLGMTDHNKHDPWFYDIDIQCRHLGWIVECQFGIEELCDRELSVSRVAENPIAFDLLSPTLVQAKTSPIRCLWRRDRATLHWRTKYAELTYLWSSLRTRIMSQFCTMLRFD